MLSNQKQIIEKAKFTHSPLGKAFEKQTKKLKTKEKTSWCFKILRIFWEAIVINKDFISKERLKLEIITELERLKDEGKKTDRSKIVYRGHIKTYDFRKFKTMRAFGHETTNNIINMHISNAE